jgi:hypothetical protein
MKASSNNWLPGAIGVLIGLGIVAAFLGDGTPFAGGAAQSLLDLGSFSRALGEFTGFGFSVALLAFGLRRLADRVLERRPAGEQDALIGSVAPAIATTTPRSYDATASELDDSRLPGFAPVVSLTEAQVDRARARRLREERHSAPRSA